MEETLEERLAAVERAVTDGEHEFPALTDTAEVANRLDEVESNLDALSDRVAELEAASQALRGYVGNVRSVNRDVERRADAALAAVESVHSQSPSDRHGEPSKTEETTSDPSRRRRESTSMMTDSDGHPDRECCPFCGGTDGQEGIGRAERRGLPDRQPSDEMSRTGASADTVGTDARKAARAATGDSPGRDTPDAADKRGDEDGLLAELRQRL